MPFRGFDAPVLRALAVLALAQVIGWGTVGLPAIVGRQIAADLGIDLATVFAGSSVLYVVMGLWAPVLAKALPRFGARLMMMSGAALAAPGFVMLALAREPIVYFAAWAVLGTAGAAMLTTSAYVALNEIAGPQSKSAIGALMVITGLSSSIFWPTTAILADAAGWRATSLVYAAAMILACLPLYAFGLPRRPADAMGGIAATGGAKPASVIRDRQTFFLIVAGIALNAFVTFGFAAILIELLKAQGLTATQAIAFGSTLGLVQISARALDLVGGGRWDGVTTGLVAGVALPVAMAVMMFGGGSAWSIAAFILIYGLGSGALAVARATIPLAFYDRAAYAEAVAHISLPLNLISALAPPLLAGLLTAVGANAVLGLAALCSTTALVLLLLLARRRPQASRWIAS
ncbi:MFS transporter [Phreatobacter sp. AB_2022a]|uniref:MFS transporter n=1 Tax=Phreatobacter sp. AB_2022a TaxID=3003134 RepID=UPI0022875A14|nr:MFS transporter [Phreatobacter sp. AB_2022a]MCZ0734292.1 MFS transporter [Phreatobacter sp. AB_2022a]